MTALQPSQTLMFAYDYYPGRTLQVVAPLQQSVTRTILGQEVDGNAIVSDTSEWNTALANYQLQGDPPVPGEYVLLFGRGGSFQQDSQLQLGTSATFFNDQFNLLEISVSTGGGGGGTPTEDGGTPTPEGDGGTPTPEQGTPTPEQGTPTPEQGTPTPEGGTPIPEGGGGGGNGGGGDAGN